MSALTHSAAWQALAAHRERLASTSLRELFAADPGRFARFSLVFDDLLFDFSKQRVTEETMALLHELARAARLEEAIADLFAGVHVNRSEDRAALHVALRAPADRAMHVDGADVMPAITRTRARMGAIAEAIRDGSFRGSSGEKITDLVHLGIGGSDLGPALVCEALASERDETPRVHFVSNVDAAHLCGVLRGLDPARTVFVVVSKTFTTTETLANARSARRWLVDGTGSEAAVARHFFAATARPDEALRFGIDPDRIFELWDWVGGRFSLWSAAGLSIACALGRRGFDELLAGAHEADEHFRGEPLASNVPVTMGLLGVWSASFLGAGSRAIVPYDHSLRRLPAYLQQLAMESNGKRVDVDGRPIDDYQTSPIVWGAPGTDGQHAFFQLLHQGTRAVAVDFLAAVRPRHPLAEHHELLLANLLAQGEALLLGTRDAELLGAPDPGSTGASIDPRSLPHRRCPGDRPSTTLLFETLDARRLGRLLALYEHEAYVQGVLWRIDSFDQWGVELGKRLTGALLPLRSCELAGHDASTRGLLEHCRRWASDDPEAVASRRRPSGRGRSPAG